MATEFFYNILQKICSTLKILRTCVFRDLIWWVFVFVHVRACNGQSWSIIGETAKKSIKITYGSIQRNTKRWNFTLNWRLRCDTCEIGKAFSYFVHPYKKRNQEKCVRNIFLMWFLRVLKNGLPNIDQTIGTSSRKSIIFFMKWDL